MRESDKIKKGEEEIIPNLIMFLKSKGMFPYKSIRAADMHDMG